jgi:E3 ubiquitin-protein ligase EDD1
MVQLSTIFWAYPKKVVHQVSGVHSSMMLVKIQKPDVFSVKTLAKTFNLVHFLCCMMSVMDFPFLLLQSILEERCDGGRNIFHTAISMCQPTSNKDSDSDPITYSYNTDPVDSITSAIQARTMSLRDMMKRVQAVSNSHSSQSHASL